MVIMYTIGADGDVEKPWTDMQDVTVLQFLYHDRRPTFVIELQSDSLEPYQPAPAVLINPALYRNQALRDLITESGSDNSSVQEGNGQILMNWIRQVGEDTAVSDIECAGFAWFSMILEARWRVFVANSTETRCICNIHTAESKPTHVSSKPFPQATLEIKQSICQSEGTVNRPLPADDKAWKNKNSSSTAKARNFFAEELQKSDIEKSIGDAQQSPSEGRTDDSHTNMPETTTSGVWSDPRIAQRNANLLDKISAFDAVGISITDSNGEIVFANDAWYEICGLAHGPMDATAWMSIFTESELPMIADVWTRIIVEQGTEQFQTPLKWRWNPPPSSAVNSCPADFPVWISVWAYADVSVDGETVGCCCLLTDISQQKWTEWLIEQQLAEAVERAKVFEKLSLDLKATETRFRRISDSMPHGIFMTSLAGNMLYTNAAYCEIFPGSDDYTAVEPWWTLVPEEEHTRATEVWRKLREDRVKVSFEMSFVKPSKSFNGSVPTEERVYTTISAYPELDEHGEIKHIAGCITDISHLKIAEQTQYARADDAEQSTHRLERFIDMTSHEIRNPLSAVLHSAEEVLAFLHNKPGEMTPNAIGNAIDTMGTIIDCTTHSTRIVDDILVVSKMDSGLLNIAPTSVQLIPAVERTLKMFDGELRSADISRSFTIDKSFEDLKIDLVCLDISRVRQILVNLITNAIKFTRPESIRTINTILHASLEKPTSLANHEDLQYLIPQVQPSATYLEPMMTGHEVVYISFSVSDSGCGLSEEDQKALFQRFSQAGIRTHVKYGGTGLGLFISRQLCEMQCGQIGLYSKPGEGSTFTFYVKASRPIHQKHSSIGLRVGNKWVHDSITPVSNKATHSYRIGTTFTILLAEDNLVNQKVVSKMLRAKGFTVLVANHGSEALDHIRGSALFSGALVNAPSIALILLDIEMPVMDGLVCIQRIRAMEDSGELRCHVPVIAITANARQEQIDQAIDAGMDDVVTKPFRMDKLLSVMTRLWEQYPT